MRNDMVEVVEFFPWNENFETGVEVIDQQHKQLVHLLNKLAINLADLSDSVELNEIFSELAAYADYHFKTEEDVWLPYFKDDLWFNSHQSTHQAFISEVLKLKEEEKLKPLEDVIDDILKFLMDWLTHHILDSDKRMALVTQGVDSGLTLEEAKTHSDDVMNGPLKHTIQAVLKMNEGMSVRTLELMKEKAERKRIDETLSAMLDSDSLD